MSRPSPRFDVDLLDPAHVRSGFPPRMVGRLEEQAREWAVSIVDDIGRTPNPHVAFGGDGVHFCLGANLAHREITIPFEELLARTREIEVLAPARFAALGLWNPVMVVPKEIQVRIA